MTELKSYDLPELETLAEQIKAEIIKREQEEQEKARQAAEAEAARQAQAAAEKAAEAARKVAEKKEATRKEAARKTAEKKAAEEAARVAAATPPPQAPQETGRIRYMHPSNRALTWSGEGAMPDWINAWLVTGGTLYALEIAAEKLAPKPIPDSFKLR